MPHHLELPGVGHSCLGQLRQWQVKAGLSSAPAICIHICEYLAKVRIVSPLGTASPRWHALHHQPRAALPEATLITRRCFPAHLLAVQRVFHLRALSTQLQAGHVLTGKAAFLCVAYIRFPADMSSFPLVGIQKE